MSIGTARTVVINRISKAGNPIADGTYKRREILVYGAQEGEKVEVLITEDAGAIIGEIINPTEEQKQRAEQHRKRRHDRFEGEYQNVKKRSLTRHLKSIVNIVGVSTKRKRPPLSTKLEKTWNEQTSSRPIGP